jgi:hypothetical protein
MEAVAAFQSIGKTVDLLNTFSRAIATAVER